MVLALWFIVYSITAYHLEYISGLLKLHALVLVDHHMRWFGG